ncbi:site-specific integrase [Maribacter dokdonensis]|uniref:site-specific integrase n=2 Tax=Maribacter dokdonensis TaxID=320912 RepID=UPI0032993BE4
MNQNNLSVLFLLKKDKTNQKGTCPIYCRITYLKKRKQFSIGEFINPLEWNAKGQKASSKTISNQQINLQLDIITANIKKAHLQLQTSDAEYGVTEILNKYLGKTEKKEEKVVSYFQKFLKRQLKLIGKDLKLSTWKKSEYVCNDVSAFIKSKYGENDYSLEKLNQSFLTDFEYYLKTVKSQKQVTVNKAIQRLRKPVKMAVAEGYLNKDPFVLHKPGRVRKQVVFLSTEELKLLEEHAFTQPRLELVRDLFIFCCYTGLAYHEMASLRKEHIIKGFDGNEWIQMKREKTDKLISIPLLPKANDVMAKYRGRGQDDYVLPRFSNQKINSYLKEIAGIVGNNKSITHHIARKTFASTVLLYNNVPMEIVSELLGHSSMKITQEHYGKVVQRRVSEEMVRISKKLH